MRMLAHKLWLLALLISTGLVQANAIGWQEAVARLAHERTRAVTCAQALRQYGDDAAKRQGAFAYSEAKAEIDAVIAGLVVALATTHDPRRPPRRIGRCVACLPTVEIVPRL